MGLPSRSGDQAGYVLWNECGVVCFIMSIGDFFKKMPQVLVRIESACLGSFYQTVKCGGGLRSVRATCEQPVLRITPLIS